MMFLSKKSLSGLVVVASLAAASTLLTGSTQRTTPIRANQKDATGAMVLPNTHRIDPAGRHIELKGDLPVRFKFSPDGKSLFVVTGGFHDHGVTAIDTQTETVRTYKAFARTTPGLLLKGDDILVARAADGVARFQLGSTVAATMATNRPPAQSWFSGLAETPSGNLLAIDQNRDLVIEFDASGAPVREAKVGGHPIAIATSPDGKTLAVSNEGSGTVSFLRADGLAVVATAKVGIHPNELTFANDGTLFVANAGSNTVSVLRDQKVVATLFTSHKPGDIVGSTPDALCLSPDQKTLYVANADAAEVAVIDVANPLKAKVKGFIPTGWYPSAVAVSPDGKKLYVGVGKGLTFASNPVSTNAEGVKRYGYIGTLLKGYVSVVDIPNAATLKKLTARVDQLAASRVAKVEGSDAITKNVFRKIKHVVYVIRENRTYDQVFGDLPGTNADPSNLMYGEEITPNAHKITRTWTTFDNIYCDGEVSQDGHQWCNAAYATRFNQHAWPSGYASKGQADEDESVNDSPAGYIWDACREAKKTYISYGENSGFRSTPDTAPIFEGSRGLKDHASVEWSIKGGRDYEKIDIFINDLKKAEQTGNWPNFMVMSLGEDHTSGLRAGAFTPNACVASNDLALGKMVEAITKSKFWSETAIFVIEDDAQNGPDHVDAHRTVGLVISPYTKRGVVDSNLYSTGSMLKTMELMLGLKHMTQHDRGSNAMFTAFTTKPDLTPYTALAARVDLEAKNPGRTALAKLSEKLNLNGYDRSDPALMNEILWRDAHPTRPMPPVVSSIAR
ncbi:MAG: bifunctional YncE family protein/alkaline phosphatase family protein [Fimbriimonas sp.]